MGITKNAVNFNLNSSNSAKKTAGTIGGGYYVCTPAWVGSGCGTYYSDAYRTGNSDIWGRSASVQLATDSYICENGFLKHVNAKGEVCTDSCWWEDSCSGDHYVNAEDSSNNYSFNLQEYERAIRLNLQILRFQ